MFYTPKAFFGVLYLLLWIHLAEPVQHFAEPGVVGVALEGILDPIVNILHGIGVELANVAPMKDT